MFDDIPSASIASRYSIEFGQNWSLSISFELFEEFASASFRKSRERENILSIDLTHDGGVSGGEVGVFGIAADV
jgi:hypothetical protein